MGKNSPVKQSQSTKSIDISKPDGISSFWNLFPKKIKKEKLLQNGANNVEPKLKINSFVMKMLKLKGIDIKNLEDIDINDLSRQKNKIVLISPDQTNFDKNELTKRDILLSLLQSKNGLKDINDFKASFMTPSTVSVTAKKVLASSSKTYVGSKKPKVNTNNDNKKTIIKLSEVENSTLNLLSNTVSESMLFKAVPKAKLKSSKRKRVVIPVYVGKKKSSKLSNLKKESLSDDNKQSNLFDDPLLINKIKMMEEQINNLKCKTNKSKDPSWKASLKINALSPSSKKLLQHLQPKAATLVTHRMEGISGLNITKVQPSRRSDKENILINEILRKHQVKRTLSSDYHDRNASNPGVVSKQRLGNFNDLFYNPDLLIKNHKLIIPGDISEEGLFRANPYAGCDTILKLFKALSKEKENNDQPPETVRLKSSAQITGHFPTTSANISLENDNCKRNKNSLRNIFSLPMNLDILRTSKYNSSDKETKVYEPENPIVDKSKKSLNNIKEETIGVNFSKGEKACQVKDLSMQSNLSLQNVTGSVKEESEPKKFFKEISGIIKPSSSKSCDGILNKSNIISRNITSSHQSPNCSTISKEEPVDDSCCNISAETLNTKVKRSIDTMQPNVSHGDCETPGTEKQTQKLLFKKTTISCPVETPEQKVSITILIKGNFSDGKNLLNKEDPSAETTTFTQFREIQNTRSSLDLEKLQSGKEGLTNPNKNLQDSKEFFYLTHPESPSFCKRKLENVNTVNEPSIFKQSLEESLSFGLSSTPYLNQEQRKTFDEKVLGVDHYEKSINLSNLKFKHKREENLLKPVIYRPGLINILSESSIVNTEADPRNQFKVSALCNRKILHRIGRCYSRNPFYMGRSSVKKQSRTKITEEDNPFSRDTKNVNNPQVVSLNQIKLPFLSNNANECMESKQFKPHLKNHLGGSEYTQNSGPVDIKKKSCRFNLTLSQNPVVTEAKNDFPLFKMSRGDHQIEKNRTVYVEPNYNEGGNYWLNSTTHSSSDRFQLFKDFSINSLQENKFDQRKSCVQTDFNIVNNSQISFVLHNPKLDISCEKSNSITAEKLLENCISVASDRKSENLKTHSSNSQYKKVGNGKRFAYSSEHVNQLFQDNPKNFQHEKTINSEVLLCACSLKNQQEIREEQHVLNSSVNRDPQVIVYKKFKTLSSQNILNGPNQDILGNNTEENRITQNINETKSFHCCSIACLTVISEEDLFKRMRL